MKNKTKSFCTMGLAAVGVAFLTPTAAIPVGIAAGLALSLILIEKGYDTYNGNNKKSLEDPVTGKVNDPSKVMSLIGSIRENGSGEKLVTPLKFKIGK